MANGYNPTLVKFGMSSKIDVDEVGGTRDYNKLSNIPIKNLVGEDLAPIILSELEPGRYSLTGLYNNGDAVTQTETPLDITVADLNGERLMYYIEMTHFDVKVHLLRFDGGVLKDHRAQSMLGASFANMEDGDGN